MLGNPLNLFMMSDNDVEILGLIAKKYAQRCGHKYGPHIYMIQIVRRHLTSKPDLEASVELLAITYSLSRISEQEFREALTCWYEKWRGFFPKRASALTIGCILHIRGQEPHTDRLNSIYHTSGLLSIIRSYASPTPTLQLKA